MIVGNFSVDNPGREEMEVYGKWFLNHRSESELISCAIKAGIPKNKLFVRKEETGVNLFLHANK